MQTRVTSRHWGRKQGSMFFFLIDWMHWGIGMSWIFIVTIKWLPNSSLSSILQIICNGWLLHSWPLFAWFEYVCMCKCSHVCCGFLIVSVFAKVFPNARGWTFPSERWKQLGSKGPGWRSWLRRWMFHDFLCSWIRSSWIYEDLCCFVELEHTLRWDVLRYTVHMGVGRSLLCSWLEFPGSFSRSC